MGTRPPEERAAEVRELEELNSDRAETHQQSQRRSANGLT
jgi:hypothetical protein